MSQNEVARRTGKHTSFISRVERPDARLGVPKRETVEGILEAIEATPEERAAVFHIEEAPQSSVEIAQQVDAARAYYENGDVMAILLDARWVRRYVSQAYSRLIALTPDEHERVLGEHVLISLVDPASPMYGRYPESERLREFSTRAALFKLRFAEQQFDSWYLELEEKLTRFPYVETIWHSLPIKPTFADAVMVHQLLPDGAQVNLNVQLRQMYDAPRFTYLEIHPADSESAAEVARRLSG